MDCVREGDCMQHLREMDSHSVDLIVTDPPYNIGYAYDDYDDNLNPDEYVWWCEGWMRQCHRVLSKQGSFWLIIGDEYVSELDIVAKKLGFFPRSKVIWYYTFGVNCAKNFSRSHTHLLYYTRHKKNFTFNKSGISVPSARQMVYGDSRANPDGRVPDNTWILRPQEIEESFSESEDTWHVSRVCGTFGERIAGASNQLPEALCERIIKACSNEGDVVLDPFGGTGTVAVVAKRLERIPITIELSPKWVGEIRKRLAG